MSRAAGTADGVAPSTWSAGIAAVALSPETGRGDPEAALGAAALGAAREAALAAELSGGDRARLAGESFARDALKKDFPSIAARNRAAAAVLRALDERRGFLLVGHLNPDEDCFASLVAFALLAVKMGKKVVVQLSSKPAPQFSYLLDICAYNGIAIAEGDELPPVVLDTFVALDTPKPDMLDMGAGARDLFASPEVLRIEADHHLESDAEYIGDAGYRMVGDATSTGELVGILAYKLSGNARLLARRGIADVFTRNLVLAVLTGVLGDSKMGTFLKTPRERRLYAWFTGMFESMLARTTRAGSTNFASKEALFGAIAASSEAEAGCYERLVAAAVRTPYVDYVALDAAEADALRSEFGADAFLPAVKSAADALAEANGRLSLVAYPDADGDSGLVQFRIRRSRSFEGIDLRDLLSRFGFLNGGGHPGAVGFRLPKPDVVDPKAFSRRLAEGIAAWAALLGVHPA